ncbi:hypothetical protein HDV63DRAFT_375980 [Trichoderma sp. SZMC 28014]
MPTQTNSRIRTKERQGQKTCEAQICIVLFLSFVAFNFYSPLPPFAIQPACSPSCDMLVGLTFGVFQFNSLVPSLGLRIRSYLVVCPLIVMIHHSHNQHNATYTEQL